jgi:hypothetical protein
MSIRRIGDSVRSTLKIALVILFTYACISLLLTSIWGKQIILIRNGISESQILYETPNDSKSRIVFIIYHDGDKYGLIEAYPSGTIHLLKTSFYNYSVDVKTGVVNYSERYEQIGGTNCVYNATRENVGVKTRIGNEEDGTLIYKYFVIVHNQQHLFELQPYEYKYELDNNQSIYLFDSSTELNEQICLNVKFL